MNEIRSFASLEPKLLARKGGAKPAMRPQVGLAHALALSPIDDLGWNDMGEADEDALETELEAEVVALAPANGAGDAAADGASKSGAVKGQPEVRRQIQAIAAHLAKRDDRKPAQEQVKLPRESALESGRRAAFTLRLDAQRHLKLRLACTVKNRSAQQIVTEALDRLLSGMPEIDSLAAQLKQR
jgi:hypothetical protein